ncbi:MAG TPA: bifunctional adenosylcobinamide kinase/adenosylcobinamide-phosphate guanylyltransferase [Pseudogracilibacillus sp.]|nr:bifunctional adenosylcobinamide kinase/adenosylcobinamide-phosphate guanylyltransferase [Pseudogracilibacillus sp.]
MHVITGGAYNGKWEFVKQLYNLTNETDFIKYSGYNNDELPNDFSNIQTQYLIIQNLELYVKAFFENEKSVPSQIEKFVLNCLNWQEQNPNALLILIGSDISKGVVPIDKADREWRDMTGIMYQKLVQMSERFDIIWYGINRQLK